MSQTQAIFTQATTSRSFIDIVRNAVSETVDWLGHTITHITDVVAGYVRKVLDFIARCFETVVDLIRPKHHHPLPFKMRVTY